MDTIEHALHHPAGQLSAVHRVSIDTINSGTLDNTVDTDGKNRDAQRRHPGDNDDVASHATLTNAVWTSPTGLAGFDSRRKDRIATLPGTQVVANGWSIVSTWQDHHSASPTNGSMDAPGGAWWAWPLHNPRHMAVNHRRIGRMLTLTPRA